MLPVTAQDNDTYISEEIQEACIKYGEEYGICPELLMAMIEKESSGNPDAKNGSCVGLMQVNKAFHKERMERLGVDDLTDIDENIHVGTDYLYELFVEYEDCGLVLDTYNGNSKAEYYAQNGILSSYAKKILERSAELESIHMKKGT